MQLASFHDDGVELRNKMPVVRGQMDDDEDWEFGGKVSLNGFGGGP